MKRSNLLVTAMAMTLMAGAAHADGTFADSWLPSNGGSIGGIDSTDSAIMHNQNAGTAQLLQEPNHTTTINNTYNSSVGVQNNLSVNGSNNTVDGDLNGTLRDSDVTNTGVNSGGDGIITLGN